MRAVVVGGGVAGPAVALALREVGVDAVVLEGRHEHDPGAGSWFTVAPNGIAALAELGALETVRHLGVPTRRHVMNGATGRPLGVLGTGAPLPDGTPAQSFRRSDLSASLLGECARRGITVRYGARVADVATTAGVATARLESGETLEADIVIGADGIRSRVRQAIDPSAPEPRYLGLTNFGGLTRRPALAQRLTPEAWHFVFGRRAFWGALPTPDGDVVWFANVRRRPISREERAGTSEQEWRLMLLELARYDDGPMAGLVEAGELELWGDSTYDLPRLPRWHHQRLVLVGDAAHAPSPSSGQGASLALEDAVVLATSLAAADTPEAAFASYEGARRSRTEKVVAQGARSSSAKNPGIGRVLQEQAMRLVFRYAVTERSQSWLVDHRVQLASHSPG